MNQFTFVFLSSHGEKDGDEVRKVVELDRTALSELQEVV